MNNKTISISIKIFILYIFFGWFFSRTVFASSYMVYISFIGITILFIGAFMSRSKKVYLNPVFNAWAGFLLLTMGSLLYLGKIEYLSYWCICTILLINISRLNNYSDYINEKLIFYIGLFLCLGLLLEFFFIDFYNEHILKYYLNKEILSLASNEYGLTGFTYQMDTTGVPIVLAEGMLLFYIYPTRKITKSKATIILVLFIFCIFLTGKRILMVISILMPFLVFLFTPKNIKSKIFGTIILIAGITIIYGLLIHFSDYLINVPYMGRFVKAVVEYGNEDITTGRSALWKKAIALFKDNPILGIGVGNYILVSGSYTDVHNTYLQVLCEQGIIGFVLYLIGLLFTFVYSINLMIKYNLNENDKALCKYIIFVQMVYLSYCFSGNLNTNMFGYCSYFLYISFLPCIEYKYNRGGNE